MALLCAGIVIILLLVLVLHLISLVYEANARIERMNQVVLRIHRERNRAG
jgi:hypothetical protein